MMAAAEVHDRRALEVEMTFLVGEVEVPLMGAVVDPWLFL